VEDIEIDGVVCYGPLPDPTWPDCWYVCTDAKSFRFVHVKRENEEAPYFLPCFQCGVNIYEHLNSGRCPVCGLDVEHARRRLKPQL
jgi:hypothetical protein